ncbi:EAL domain-containing protein [Nevskia sp.]|uniref:putative bifunctional diguanylate cyclase/phosphodiesterase n=1 Tax=Nevskia sp. TaxID=1929292 RepID=UPI0025DB1B00|nr:EAL domain-containing protein [Nevskia sp.]
MKNPFLSVRMRLLALCLGSVLVLGGASAFIVLLMVQDQQDREERQTQFERYETVHAVQQAQGLFRHRSGQTTSANAMGDKAALDAARTAQQVAKTNLDRELLRFARFDETSAKRIEDANSAVADLSDRAIAAMVAGRQPEVVSNLTDLQQRLDQIEETLRAAKLREQTQLHQRQTGERQRVENAIRFASLVIGGAIILGLIATFTVVRSVIRPLQITTDAIRQVNAGAIEIDLPPIRPDEFGDMAVALRQFRDQAERLRRLAYYDPLTGLGNRARLEESLQRAIDRSRQTREPVALFYVDLDNFRAVNDKFGHKAGDRYLGEAASRLNRFMPPGAQLCRHSGDKFAITIDRLDAGSSLENTLREQADSVLRGVSESYPLGDHLLHMAVSIGIAVFPGDGETAEQIIASAEAAMYVAKKNGRNNARFASAQLTGTMRKQLALASEIRRGLERGEFEPFYQPVVDVEQGRVIGAEALLRWRHPENGLMPPSDFIQVAEESGLINQLGELCLIKAHEQAQVWASRNRRIRVSVNLSVRQVHDGKILQILRGFGSSPGSRERLIDFELTESALLDSTEYSHTMLTEIKRLGFRIGLDDFGTGYSSFSYLQRLPIDKIKIDRQFVTAMGASKQALAIVSATLTLAQNLDLGVIAEGVESTEQMRQLRILGCKLQQGFYFTRALPAADFEAWSIAFERGGMEAHALSVASREPVTIGLR